MSSAAKGSKVKAAAWSEAGGLFALVARGAKHVVLELRRREVVAEHVAQSSANRVAVLPSGAVVTSARALPSNAKLVRPGAKGRSFVHVALA